MRRYCLSIRFDSARLTVDELQYAETELIKHVQTQELFSVISGLNTDLFLETSPRFLHKLSPILIDGVLRVDSRLRNAPR